MTVINESSISEIPKPLRVTDFYSFVALFSKAAKATSVVRQRGGDGRRRTFLNIVTTQSLSEWASLVVRRCSQW
jgi:hypothetical protein